MLILVNWIYLSLIYVECTLYLFYWQNNVSHGLLILKIFKLKNSSQHPSRISHSRRDQMVWSKLQSAVSGGSHKHLLNLTSARICSHESKQVIAFLLKPFITCCWRQRLQKIASRQSESVQRAGVVKGALHGAKRNCDYAVYLQRKFDFHVICGASWKLPKGCLVVAS